MRGFLHVAPKRPYLKLREGATKKANCIICNIRNMKKRKCCKTMTLNTMISNISDLVELFVPPTRGQLGSYKGLKGADVISG